MGKDKSRMREEMKKKMEEKLKRKKKKRKDKKKKKKNDSMTDMQRDLQVGGGPNAHTSISKNETVGERNISVPIKLCGDTNAPTVKKDSAAKSDASGWSWGAAFAAASRVQPNDDDLDDNFLKSTAVASGSDGVNNISKLVNDHEKKQSNDTKAIQSENSFDGKMKRKRSEDSNSTSNDDIDADVDDDDMTLEGRMVSISASNGSNEMSLVLVHKQSGKVYSSGERTTEGHRLVIGKLVKGDDVELDPLAVEEMKRLDKGGDNVTSSQHPNHAPTGGPSFPYPTNPDDHCETPLQSYKDIVPILNQLCKSYGGINNTDSMKIYDPYYCDGSVVKHLSSLGFSNVYNKKEDCYVVWKSNSEPQYDVFLTNPPYSEDHIEKLMTHITSPSFGNKPWLLLMPTWVHKKDYYINATTNNQKRTCNPFYIVPKKRYVYKPPSNFREKKESDVHKKSSPFVSMWYCWGGSDERNVELMNAFRNSSATNDCDLARSKSALRDLRRSGSTGDKIAKKALRNLRKRESKAKRKAKKAKHH